MIQPGTRLEVADNSGARIVECIKVLNKKGRSTGSLGSTIVVSVKKLRLRGRIKVKKKEVCLALVIQVKRSVMRSGGICFKFSRNKCILLTRTNKLIGTRIFGLLSKDLRKQKRVKVLSLGARFI